MCVEWIPDSGVYYEARLGFMYRPYQDMIESYYGEPWHMKWDEIVGATGYYSYCSRDIRKVRKFIDEQQKEWDERKKDYITSIHANGKPTFYEYAFNDKTHSLGVPMDKQALETFAVLDNRHYRLQSVWCNTHLEDRNTIKYNFVQVPPHSGFIVELLGLYDGK